MRQPPIVARASEALRGQRVRATTFARLVPFLAGLVLVALTLVMFGVARGVVQDQEDRLLRERAGEVEALLSSSIKEIASSLQVLGALGSLQDRDAARLFTLSADAVVEGDTLGVGVATRRGGEFTVIASAGEGPAVGENVTGRLGALATRARAAGALTTAPVADSDGTRLVLAQPTTGARNAVAYQLVRIRPDVPLPRTAESPFRDLRIALYAAPQVEPSQLIVSTEKRVPLEGDVRRAPFPVGADQWLLAVQARDPLVGSFARAAPWMLLASGLLVAAFATAVVLTLSRRRDYAEKLVVQRTRDLDEARAFLERLAAAAPLVVRRLNVPDAQVTYVSPNIHRIFGVSPEAARALPFGETVHPDDRPAFESAYQEVADGRAAKAKVEYRASLPSGPRWVFAKFVPELDGNGNVAAVISYALDIDDRKQAEQAQREAQESADTANRAKSEFLSRMSHELRTPLNAVLGFAQILELDVPESQKDSVRQILRAGRHLLDLINEVLDISRIEAGQLSLSPEAVSVPELVTEAAELMGPVAAARQVEIRTELAGCDCFVRADRQRTKQVLLNLLSNAVKYNHPAGRVSVTCTQSPSAPVSIRVQDTGIGVSAEDISRLFIPFERLGAERSDIEGTGVGLALSQRLAQVMDGHIDVTSVIGVGSTFTLTLPPADRPEAAAVPRRGLVAQRKPESASIRTVLSIEDNLANAQLLERIVERRPAWRVVHAALGRLGLDLAVADPPDLILLDLHLPDMHGVEVLRRLKALPETTEVPVAILSADATPGQVERLQGLGATVYLTKPIDVASVLDLLDAVARTTGSER